MIDPGRLILTGLPAGELDGDTLELVRGFAGFLLLRRNAAAPDQLTALIAGLDDPTQEPRLIAIDEEGGMVSRLSHFGLEAPAAMAVAATGSADTAADIARDVGHALRTLGINVVLGPCLDVLSEPLNPVIATRAFGEDAETVERFGMAAVRGYEAAGLAPVAKHFPGHGGTAEDSHTATAHVLSEASELWERDLAPFRAAVSGGVGALMTAHVCYPRATPREERDLPATLSHHWLTAVLRRQLGFDGVVLSDALEMQGVAAGRDLEHVAQTALTAGVDLFVCEDLETALRTRGLLAGAAKRHSAVAERLASSAQRVDNWRRHLPRTAVPGPPIEALRRATEATNAIRASTIAVAGDPMGALPLDPDQPLLFVLPRELDASRPVDVDFLRTETQARFKEGRVIALEPAPTPGELELLGEWVRDRPNLAVVLGVMGRRPADWVPEATVRLAQSDGPRVGVALSRPADVQWVAPDWPRLLTYGFERPALCALLDVLCGRIEASGRVLGLGAPS